MLAITDDTPSDVSSYRELVSPELFDRLVGRIVKDEELERPLAEQIMNEALGFLKLIADNPGESYSPSPLVDIGWHTFILYTRAYAEFCGRVAGRFIHHEPNDVVGRPQAPGGVGRTMNAMVASHMPVSEMLWTVGFDPRRLVLADGCTTGGSGCGTVSCDNGSGSGDPVNDCRNG